MIVKWFLDGLVAIVTFLLGLLPTVASPPWLDGALATWSQVVGDMEQLNNWVPLGAIGLVAVWQLAAFTTSVVIKFTRIGISHITGGGGSAA